VLSGFKIYHLATLTSSCHKYSRQETFNLRYFCSFRGQCYDRDFRRFSQFSAKKWDTFSRKPMLSSFFCLNGCNSSPKSSILLHFLGENIFITLTPVKPTELSKVVRDNHNKEDGHLKMVFRQWSIPKYRQLLLGLL
jgi:hypothetical protein